MSSILTNTSAMVALQTLKSVNMNLESVQSEISTGKSIASARDNSAIWAISKVMESDVKGFEAISESISLGESTVAVALNASETVTELLTDLKGRVVAAQEENVNRESIQTDIDALVNQIGSVTGAAQFNGLNLVSGFDAVNILSSLDRAPNGSVTDSDITIQRQDLTTDGGVYGTGTSLTGGAALTAADAAATGGSVSIIGGAGQNFDASSTRDFSNTANSMTVTVAGTAIGDQYNLQIGGQTVSFEATTAVVDDVASALTAALNAAEIDGVTATSALGVITISSTNSFDDLTINGTASGTGTLAAASEGGNGTAAGNGFTGAILEARASEITFDANGSVSEGDGYRVSIGGATFDYVAAAGETFQDVAEGLKIAVDSAAISGITTNVVQDEASGDWTLQVDNNNTVLTLTIDGTEDGTATGGLAGLDGIDVTTDEGVESALANIETLIKTSIDAAADFGSAQGRLETQSGFITSLTDSLKAGIGSLVDADLEAASARLQALQVQQQLATQSLSIANQAPQSILSLFR